MPSRLRGSLSPRPNRVTRTTRTSRRWSAKSISASSKTTARADPDAYSPQRRPQPHRRRGCSNSSRNVQGAVEVLHPLLTATQESYNGTSFGAFPIRASSSPTPTNPVAAVQEQPQQRGVPRPHPCRQGALLPARDGGTARSTRSCCAKANSQRAPARLKCWKV